MAVATRKRSTSAKRRDPNKSWRNLLSSLPGYDPFAQQGDCWFDAAAAQKALDFFPDLIQHVEGDLAGQPFQLERWQQAYVANLFGWKKLDDAGRIVRRYRKSLLYVPRKNGKTPFAAALSLYVFFLDDERGQQNYMAAAEREQAGFLFRQARGMVEAEKLLEEQCHIYGGTAPAGQSKSIVKNNDISYLKVISADATTKHGQNSHLIVIDELHAQPSRELYDVLSTSLASRNRKQPLFVMITTADFLRESICNEVYEYACKVRDGVVHDPAFLPCIYEVLPGEDWKSEEVWAKANPNLGISVSLEYLRAECKVAQEVPGYENTFKRLHLNMRTEADVRWLSQEQWDACGQAFDAKQLDGRDCYLAIDLANTLDVAAEALVFPPVTGDDWYALFRFWVPEEVARERERKNKTRYDEWIRRGHMVATSGDIIDYSYIREAIIADSRRYRIIRGVYDPWNATQIADELLNAGLPMEKFQQSIGNYAEGCNKLEELLRARQLRHGGHPVMRWMAANVMVHTDGRGYKMPSRKKSTEKIDGITALCMALAAAAKHAELKSETGGLSFVGVPEEKAVEQSTEPPKQEPSESGWWKSTWSDDDDDD